MFPPTRQQYHASHSHARSARMHVRACVRARALTNACMPCMHACTQTCTCARTSGGVMIRVCSHELLESVLLLHTACRVHACACAHVRVCWDASMSSASAEESLLE